MAQYNLTRQSTIQELTKAQKIYENLNAGKKTDGTTGVKPNPQQKAENDRAISTIDKAIKQIKAVAEKYNAVYGLSYLSSTNTLLSLEGIENEIKKSTPDFALDGSDTAGFDSSARIQSYNAKMGLKGGAVGVAKAIFTDKDGKLNTCKVEKAAIGVGVAGLVANKTVGTWLGTSVWPLITKAVTAMFGFSPVTTIALGVFAAAKLFTLGKKLLGPVVTKAKQSIENNKAYEAQLEAANNEVDEIGNTTPKRSANYALFENRIISVGTTLGSGTPIQKETAKKDVFKLLMDIKEAPNTVLTDEDKQELIDNIKRTAAFKDLVGDEMGNGGLKEKATNAAGKVDAGFDAKKAALKTAMQALDVSNSSTVSAVTTAIGDFKTEVGKVGLDPALKELGELLIVEMEATLERAQAKGLDTSKVKSAHNETLKELGADGKGLDL